MGYTVDNAARPQLRQGRGFAAALPHYTEHAHPSSTDGQGRGLQPSQSPHQTCCWYRQANDTPSTEGFKHTHSNHITALQESQGLTCWQQNTIFQYMFFFCGCPSYLQPYAGVTPPCKLSKGPLGPAQGREISSEARQRCCRQPWG